MVRTVKEVREKLHKGDTPRRAWSTARCLLTFGATKAIVHRRLVRIVWCGHPVYVHRKVVPSLKRVEDRIRAKEKKNHFKRWEPDTLECWNWRKVRGGKGLSKHSFGIAFDIDAADNPYYMVYKPSHTMTTPVRVLQAFKDEGWTLGCEWNQPCDTMHVSYCGG